MTKISEREVGVEVAVALRMRGVSVSDCQVWSSISIVIGPGQLSQGVVSFVVLGCSGSSRHEQHGGDGPLSRWQGCFSR